MINSKQTKTIIWSALERFSVQGVQFLLSIFVARLVSPNDYGIIAMLGIFLAVAQTFVDSGFSNALIQKKNRTEEDYSTVFYFNIIIAIGTYLAFYIFSPFISKFYNQPILEQVAKISGLTLIISSLAIVQRTKLTINLDFKTQTKISLISVVFGGPIGLYLAWKGLGVWALVMQNLTTVTFNTIIFWFYTRWKPLLCFSWSSFQQLFSFGSKILLTGFLATIYNNIYSLIIGKFFTSTELGYYNRTSTIAAFPSKNITSIIGRAVYPIQCSMQDDDVKLKGEFFKLISASSFFIFPLMVGLAALSGPLIEVLLSKKWLPAVPYLSIISIAYMWDHIMFLLWQILNVKGRSDLSLKSEILKKILSIFILIISIPFGVKIMCVGLIIYSFIDIIVVTFFVKKVIDITILDLLKVIFPIAALSISMGIVIYYSIIYVHTSLFKLLFGAMVGASYYLIVAKFFKMKELNFIFFNKTIAIS